MKIFFKILSDMMFRRCSLGLVSQSNCFQCVVSRGRQADSNIRPSRRRREVRMVDEMQRWFVAKWQRFIPPPLTLFLSLDENDEWHWPQSK